MAYKIIWAPRAASDLVEICEYISRDSQYYATLFAQRIIRIIKKIPGHPGLGRIVPEYDDVNLRENIHGDYRIIYRIKEDIKAIEIVAICHGNRLLENVFR
ncbi:MAG: type II toxin-antitoxin system RelE/ParE family toxin [bacterium]|nr:type II toxin-antitoxin system RelE/ParE family toxin [bacterium]